MLIQRATSADAPAIAALVGELLTEIMSVIGVPAFNFSLTETTSRLREFLDSQKYFVFVARDGAADKEIGFVALYESYALYAEGAFGTIPELYVRPEYRSTGVGRMLIDSAKDFGVAKNWQRLEVTTPPLPQFENTLRFYEREQFAITGGRKLKVTL
jgi:ribosomal protein S18 acetylase RimI-like enzyme